MKQISPRLFLLLCTAFICHQSLHAQTLVNLTWQDTIGHPLTTLPYQAATTDAAGNFYIAGSTYTTGAGVATLIAKYNSSGTLLWQTGATDTIIGAYIIVDVRTWRGDVYLTGMKYDSATSKSSICLYKYNASTGVYTWGKTYNGSAYGYDVAAAVNIDDSGYVYIAGTDQKSATESQMLVIRYDSSGNQKWVATYDTANMFTGATALGLTHSGTSVAVTGFSGTGYSSWSFVTTTITRTTGIMAKPAWASNGNGSFSSPAGVGQDVHGKVYIAGTATENGSNTDIKVIGYDTAFGERFLKTWGNADSLADSASRMFMDAYSNILITGYTTASNGTKQLLVLKYNNSGTLLWSRIMGGVSPIYNCVGNDITADDSLNVYVTGKVYTGNNYDFITIVFDQNGNTLWEQNYDGGGTNDIASDVVLDSLGNVYVSGTSSTTTHSTYLTLQYSPKKYTVTTVNDTAGKPLYVKDNVIVRFAPSVLDTAFVNNSGLVYGTISQVLKSSYKSTLISDFSKDYPDVNINNATFIKLAPNYRTWNTCLISKIGDTVLIPPFWSSFLMIFTTSTTTEKQVAQELKSTSPNVKWAHLNFVGYPASCANGSGCDSLTPTDTYYCERQFALHDDSTTDYTKGQMNAERAWSLEVGKPFIKVGVFDGDVWYQHEDFLIDTTNLISKVLGGADYTVSGPPLFLYDIPGQSPQNFSPHGTSVAGIIGALRNNPKGIAGVAGGNFCGGVELKNPGASLYSFGVSVPFNNSSTFIGSAVISAMNDALSNDSAINYSNMDILNCSFEFLTQDSVFDEFREKYYMSFRLGKIVVASRGENPDPGNPHYTNSIVYPACFNDDWILSVGGSSDTGGYGGLYYGYNLDVTAPCDSAMLFTTSTESGVEGYYQSFSGSSGSAPLVSGLAGLLLSYMNDTTGQPNGVNLAPEDIEEIAQRTAYFDSTGTTGNPFNTFTPPYDSVIGWGRADLGNAMHLVDKSHNRLLHFNSDSLTPAITITPLDTNINLSLIEDIPNPAVTFLPAGNYKANVFKLTEVTSHHISLPPGQSIKAFWARSSSSDSYRLFSTTGSTNTLEPYEKDTIDEINGPVTSSHATIWGYYYQIMDSATGAFKAWIPEDTMIMVGTAHTYPRMSYTVYISSDTVISTAVKPIKSELVLSVFPNPAESTFHLNLQSGKPDSYNILLFNSIGQPVKTLFSGFTDYVSANYNISEFEAGMYYIRVSSTNKSAAIKLSIVK